MIVKIDDKAIKDLSKINKPDAIKIFDKIEKLEEFPKVANLKKFTNFVPPYRLRIGNFRVLFDVENEVITIYRVRDRKDAYN